jgi:hypothetical protein
MRMGCRIAAGGSSSVGEKAVQQLLAKEIMQALTPLHRGSTVIQSLEGAGRSGAASPWYPRVSHVELA